MTKIMYIILPPHPWNMFNWLSNRQ